MTEKEIGKFMSLMPGNCAAYQLQENGTIRLLAASEDMSEISGYSKQEYVKLIGDDVFRIVLEGDRERLRRAIACCFQPPGRAECMYRIFQKETKFTWVHAQAKSVGKIKGRPVIFVEFSHASRNMETQGSLLDDMEELVYVCDAQTRELFYANRSAQEQHEGMGMEHYLGHTCYAYMYGRENPCTNCILDIVSEETAWDEVRYDAGLDRYQRIRQKLIFWYGRKACMHVVNDITAEKQREIRLQRNQKRYRLAVESAQLMVWEYDVKTRCVYMQDSRLRRFDFYEGNICRNVPQSILPFIEEQDVPGLLRMYQEIDAGVPRTSCDVWFKAAAGQPARCERISYSVICDKDGYPVKAYGIGQDITMQKMAEEKYQRSIEDLLSANPQCLGLFHLNLTKNWCGDGYGATEQEKKLQESGSVDGFLRAVQQVMVVDEEQKLFAQRFSRQKLLTAFRRGENYLTYDYQRKNAAGEVHWATICIRLAQNPKNSDTEAVVYALDIEDEVKQEQIARRLTTGEYDFVALIHVRRKTMEFFNRKDGLDSVLELGYQYTEQGIHDIMEQSIAQEDLQDFLAVLTLDNVLHRLQTEGDFVISLFQHDQSGQRFHKQVKFCWLTEEKRDILVIKLDITEIDRLEEEHTAKLHAALLKAEQANEAKSAFLSNISHDMRTPLNGILGFTELAIHEELPEKKAEYLQKIKTSGVFLLDLINDTLDLSKIESGKILLAPKDVRLEDLLEKVVIPIRSTAALHGVRFVLHRERSHFGCVRVDGLKLQKVFLNLLSNAVKFTPEGGCVELVVEGPADFAAGMNCHVIVRDTGVGISPDFLPKIFQPFAQEDSAWNRNVRGTGLGLSIVKRMVSLMGGRIEVRSELGQGTRFDVWLYLESAKEKAMEECPVDVQQEELQSLAGKKVMVCEDNPLNMEIAQSLLEDRQMQVLCTENGKEAVEAAAAAKEGELAAILMDIRMPVMDGYEAAQAIRDLPREDMKRIPILALSGDAYDEDIQKCQEAGMDGHLAKPINPRQLFQELARLVREKSAEK